MLGQSFLPAYLATCSLTPLSNKLPDLVGHFFQVELRRDFSVYRVVEKDGLQRQFSTLEEETVSARYGDSVFLTIDCNIQSIVEEELEKACKPFKNCINIHEAGFSGKDFTVLGYGAGITRHRLI